VRALRESSELGGHARAAARRRRALCLVRAARRAAARRTCGPFVRAARRAAALRARGDRRRAALFAWRDSALREAAPRASCFRARLIARERVREGRVCRRPARLAYAALRFVLAFALAGGRGSFTPARRAFERPMAMACLVDRAPCFPWRMCSISSWTNSPAWVLGAFPARFARRARLRVSCSGMIFNPLLTNEAIPAPQAFWRGACIRNDAGSHYEQTHQRESRSLQDCWP
jgi:hypothetical protein